MNPSSHELDVSERFVDGIAEEDAILLSMLLDGELEGQEAEVLRQRIEEDPLLKKEWENLNAGQELVKRAAPVETGSNPTRGFSGFAAQLATSFPEEVNVAPVANKPWLRRIFMVVVLFVLGLILLNVFGRLIKKLEGQPRSAWHLKEIQGDFKLQRDEALLFVDQSEPLRFLDLLHLDFKEEATLSGPQGIEIKVFGPAILQFERNQGLFLKEGQMEVRAKNEEAVKALKLRTPDGEILSDEKGLLSFTVQVEPAFAE